MDPNNSHVCFLSSSSHHVPTAKHNSLHQQPQRQDHKRRSQTSTTRSLQHLWQAHRHRRLKAPKNARSGFPRLCRSRRRNNRSPRMRGHDLLRQAHGTPTSSFIVYQSLITLTKANHLRQNKVLRDPCTRRPQLCPSKRQRNRRHIPERQAHTRRRQASRRKTGKERKVGRVVR